MPLILGKRKEDNLLKKKKKETDILSINLIFLKNYKHAIKASYVYNFGLLTVFS